MARQPVVYVTYMDPAHGGGCMPPPYPGPGVQHAHARTPPHRADRPVTVPKEMRRRKWTMFALGNLISMAVVVWEIKQLNVCFDENLSDDDDTPVENASYTFGFMMFGLLLDLLVDVTSAVILSVVYRSPLDIKSVHKIPPGDVRHCGGTFIVHFLAPFYWGLVYFVGAFVSVMYGGNSPCGGGVGGSGLESYLTLAGGLMFMFSFMMLALSVVMLLVACTSSCSGSPDHPGCCATVRDMLHKRLMSKSPLFDLGWKVQGAILSYRVGSFSLAAAILASAFGLVGEVLADFGSFAPVKEMVGPMIV